jgi:Tfp pilus assembly protein FimT
MKSRHRNRGQSLVEYSVLIAVAVAAVMAIMNYARMAFSVYTIDVQEELGGRP